MLGTIYLAAWIALGASIVLTTFTGTMTPVAGVVYGFLALGLVFALMLWSVIANVPKPRSR